MNSILRRRRGLIAKTKIQADMVFATTYHKNLPTGAGTWSDNEYTITGETTGSASWGFFISPSALADGSPLTSISSWIGHKFRIEIEHEWINQPSGATFYISVGGQQYSDGHGTRYAYHSYYVTGNSGKITDEFIINENYFDSNSAQYSGSHYLDWRAYLYSSSGGKITATVKVFDLGVVT